MKKTAAILSILSILTFTAILPAYSNTGHVNPTNTQLVDIDIDDIIIDSQRELDLVRDFDPGEGIATLANINGHIAGVNLKAKPKPVHVTLKIGGQNYTTLTSAKGYFSFLVYANRSKYSLEAWSHKSPTAKKISHARPQNHISSSENLRVKTYLKKNFNLKKVTVK